MIDVLTQRIGTMQNPVSGTEAERINSDDTNTPSFGRQFRKLLKVNYYIFPFLIKFNKKIFVYF